MRRKKPPAKVMVIGAGTVGVCTALYLQRDGHEVTLVDPIDPGTGCSYGNAGVIQVSACVPIATLYSPVVFAFNVRVPIPVFSLP